MVFRKKLFFFRLCALLAFAFPAALHAQFTFTTNNGAITITKYIGADANVVIPNATNGWSVTTIGDSAFASCTGVTNVTIPDSITSIGDDVFAGCSSLAAMNFPNSVTNVGSFCFFRCTNLISVTLSTNITSLGDNFFSYCSSLTNLVLPSQINTLGEAVFANCTSLTNLVIPDSVTNMGDLEFNFCSGLTSITIGNHVPNIDQFTFEACSNLTSITLPNSVTNIGSYAFASCSSLTNLTIDNSVTTIQAWGLAACQGLTNINIPASVTNIGRYAFIGCTNLISITVDANNPAYCSVAGVLFDKARNTLIQCPSALTGDYTIPDGTKNIGTNAFPLWMRLTFLTVPATVTNIADQALISSSVLAGIFFQGSAPDIGPSTFSGDTATIYYLPGTTGWSSPFGGLSAVLWNPQAQTADGNFGVKSDQFGFNITGTANIPIVIQTSTNAAGPWLPLQSISLTNSSVYFSDPQWNDYSSRYYRISSP